MPDLSEEIDNSLKVLFEIVKKTKKKDLLDQGSTVFLQIGLFKVPWINSSKRKFLKLRHSLYGDEPDICLFVPNRKTGVEYKKTTDELIDFCVDYYTELLEKHKIKGISTVMPLKQLKSEYGSYELRRKLVNRFDLFLCKNSLLRNERFLSALGKFFYKANKYPLGISFPKADAEYDPEFQKSINRAIYTSAFYIKPFSDNYTIPIGNLSNKKLELQENVNTVLDQLFSQKILPGGFNNVRAIYLWPSQSKSIPIYIAPAIPAKLPRPKVASSSKKKFEAVQGELSTIPGKQVTVTPRGEVFVTSIYDNQSEVEFESESSVDEGSDDDEEEKDKEKSKKKTKNNKKSEENEKSGSESEGDDEIEEREQRLLKKRLAEENSFTTAKKARKGDADEDEEDDDDDDEDNDDIEDEEKEINMNKKTKQNGIKSKKENGRVKNLGEWKGPTKLQAEGKKKNKKVTKSNKATKKQLIKQKKLKLNEKKKKNKEKTQKKKK